MYRAWAQIVSYVQYVPQQSRISQPTISVTICVMASRGKIVDVVRFPAVWSERLR